MPPRKSVLFGRWSRKSKHTAPQETTSSTGNTPSTMNLLEGQPVHSRFSAHHLVVAAGVAIFHVASERVVVCYHTRHGYWFLPKGRRDAGEITERAAEREGFEESGYRNRLLPLPIKHRQPRPHSVETPSPTARYVVEPPWTEFLPLSTRTQYLLFWYIAETLPPDVELVLNLEADAADSSTPPYLQPPAYPSDLKLIDRVENEPEGYIPPRHEGTGVNEDEMQYDSHLLHIEDAIAKLGRSVMAEVVREGWEAVQERLKEEREGESGNDGDD